MIIEIIHITSDIHFAYVLTYLFVHEYIFRQACVVFRKNKWHE